MTLTPWSGAIDVVVTLAEQHRIGIVTNCSVRLGQTAAQRILVRWDVIVTAEDAGYYKPHPRPYEMALKQLGVAAHEASFVAGSGYDLFGTAAIGLRTYWHNRVGLPAPAGAPRVECEARDFAGLLAFTRGA